MANGGIDIPQQLKTVAQLDAEIVKSSEIVRAAHKDANGLREIKGYDVAKRLKSVPGTYHRSQKGKASKFDNLLGAIPEWPHLIQYQGNTTTFTFLSLDLHRFE